MSFLLGSLLLAPLVDTIAEPQIYTVQFYRGENTLSFPFLGLDEPNYLTIEFDELGVESPSEFWVRVRLCTAEWLPSSLPLTEYWRGFITDRLTEFSPSVGTRVPYIHYRYTLPNLFLRSGLYVIEVYRDEVGSRLVLRRRFYVVENKVRIILDKESQVLTGGRQQLQTIAFSVYPMQLQSPQAYQEFSCLLLQNGRWDNARALLKPTFLQNDRLEYRFQPGLDVSAGVEFRLLDIRSVLRRRSPQVERTLWSDSGIVVLLLPDQPRAGLAYTRQLDLNGRFFIQLQEALLDTARRWVGRDAQSASHADYFWVEFRLRVSLPYEKPLYIVGGMMGWGPDPRFQLIYEPDHSQYRRRIPLKQGVYDYLYALWDEAQRAFFPEPVEGSYFETENTYTILVLYKGFADRESRVVGHRWISSYE
ncbi:MAG: DUF5103 domain-containing protein [Bacteroidia bacterium]|nr:DUF5103 domain-containing protein [Bacteroidia bacterium]MDW8015966.1 DUF5103 domain-containing protein [Bacteroidia bacterium]